MRRPSYRAGPPPPMPAAGAGAGAPTAVVAVAPVAGAGRGRHVRGGGRARAGEPNRPVDAPTPDPAGRSRSAPLLHGCGRSPGRVAGVDARGLRLLASRHGRLQRRRRSCSQRVRPRPPRRHPRRGCLVTLAGRGGGAGRSGPGPVRRFPRRVALPTGFERWPTDRRSTGAAASPRRTVSVPAAPDPLPPGSALAIVALSLPMRRSWTRTPWMPMHCGSSPLSPPAVGRRDACFDIYTYFGDPYGSYIASAVRPATCSPSP